MFINSDYAEVFKEKNILITGSVGTVGSEMLKQILAFKPSEVRLFDNNESGLFMQYQTHKNGTEIIPIMGDIRDGGKLNSAMEGIDTVFHLAAYKHVEMCEHNPFDAVRTNVIGTQNVLKTALSHKVKRVIYTSSDKAVNPTNVMGTSKLLAERVVTASCIKRFNGCKQLTFSSTRFGNVLGSNGSVVPVFMEQIRHGGPVTVTDIRMTRFIMTVQEAAALVIKGAAYACGGEVFVTKMPVVKIIDLAQAMIELLSLFYGYSPEEIPIEFVGTKPGEKMYEELMSEEETIRAVELEDMFSILPALLHNGDAKSYMYPGFISAQVRNPYISRTEIPMTKDQVKKYLLSNNVLGEHITSSLNNNLKEHSHFEAAYK